MINVAINCLKRLLINFAINFVLNYMINYQLFSPGFVVCHRDSTTWFPPGTAWVRVTKQLKHSEPDLLRRKEK